VTIGKAQSQVRRLRVNRVYRCGIRTPVYCTAEKLYCDELDSFVSHKMNSLAVIWRCLRDLNPGLARNHHPTGYVLVALIIVTGGDQCQQSVGDALVYEGSKKMVCLIPSAALCRQAR